MSRHDVSAKTFSLGERPTLEMVNASPVGAAQGAAACNLAAWAMGQRQPPPLAARSSNNAGVNSQSRRPLVPKERAICPGWGSAGRVQIRHNRCTGASRVSKFSGNEFRHHDFGRSARPRPCAVERRVGNRVIELDKPHQAAATARSP